MSTDARSTIISGGATVIAERPEIEILAFEFATGCGRGERIDWHVEPALRTRRPGRTFACDSCSRRRTKARRAAAVLRAGDIGRERGVRAYHPAPAGLSFRSGGRLKWAKFATPVGAPIDELFAHNVTPCPRYSYETRLHAAIASRPLPRRPQRAAYRDGEAVQPRLLNELNLASEARCVAPEPQGVVATAKS